MEVVGVDERFELLREGGRVGVGEGADARADARGDVPHPRRWVAVRRGLDLHPVLQLQSFDDRRERRVHLGHPFEGDVRNLEALPDGDVERAVPEPLRDLRDGLHKFGVEVSARHADADRRCAAHLRDAEGVLRHFLSVEVEGHLASPLSR
jgi:hypothetical protein